MSELSKSEIEKFTEHIKSHAADMSCPVCKSKSVSVSDQVSLITREPLNQPGVLNVFPVVALICRRCANVRLFAWKPIFGSSA